MMTMLFDAAAGAVAGGAAYLAYAAWKARRRRRDAVRTGRRPGSDMWFI